MREKLREVRLNRKMTQSNIAQKLCIDRTYYNKMENGHKRISLEMGLKLKEILNYKKDDLFENN